MNLVQKVSAKQSNLESLLIKLLKEKDSFARSETMRSMILDERNAAAGPKFDVDHFKSFLLSEDFTNVMIQKAGFHKADHLLKFR
jgi:hypothetical protein